MQNSQLSKLTDEDVNKDSAHNRGLDSIQKTSVSQSLQAHDYVRVSGSPSGWRLARIENEYINKRASSNKYSLNSCGPGGGDGDDPRAHNCQRGDSSADSSPQASTCTCSQEDQGACKTPSGPRCGVSMQEMRQVRQNLHGKRLCVLTTGSIYYQHDASDMTCNHLHVQRPQIQVHTNTHRSQQRGWLSKLLLSEVNGH